MWISSSDYATGAYSLTLHRQAGPEVLIYAGIDDEDWRIRRTGATQAQFPMRSQNPTTLEGNGPNNIVRVDAKTKAYLHPES
jgi:hypothetical protein